METSPNSAQRLALLALQRGGLQRTEQGWIVSTEEEDQMLGGEVVRWLFGERYTELDPDAPHGSETYRLSDRGRTAADAAAEWEEIRRRGTTLETPLRGVPVLLVAPAAHSEEMDWLLGVPLDAGRVARHRVRLRALRDVHEASPEHFEFIQYVDEIFAVPVSPRAAELGLIPPSEDGWLFLPHGVQNADELGVLQCTDRGVNYARTWLQWFGGFDRESPLIVGEKIDTQVFESILDAARRSERGAMDGTPSGREPAGGGPQPQDPLESWDAARRRCPVVHEEVAETGTSWSIVGHAETLEVLYDHATYSNRVSTHLSIPNGMDPPEHGRFRTIVEEFFSPERMADFEPACRAIASDVSESFAAQGGGDAVDELGVPYAVRIQCGFMGWPPAMQAALAEWQDANHRATRAADETATAKVAQEFERRIGAVLDERRAQGEDAPNDATTQLLRHEVDGRPLRDHEIVSIVRNWTAGELGTIAASVGILLHALGEDPALQVRLRDDPRLLPQAIDEVLRVRGPLVANRRVATRDATLAGEEIREGERLRILWPAANRDERAFDDPARIRIERDPSRNLLYGAGIHVCPGAPLARLELRVIMEELLRRTAAVELDPQRAVAFADPPKGGFERVPVVVRRSV